MPSRLIAQGQARSLPSCLLAGLGQRHGVQHLDRHPAAPRAVDDRPLAELGRAEPAGHARRFRRRTAGDRQDEREPEGEAARQAGFSSIARMEKD